METVRFEPGQKVHFQWDGGEYAGVAEAHQSGFVIIRTDGFGSSRLVAARDRNVWFPGQKREEEQPGEVAKPKPEAAGEATAGGALIRDQMQLRPVDMTAS